VRTPLDAFLLERLLKEGMRPAPEADRRTLARRLWFDLTGLPPSPEEVDAFVNDPAPDAWERLVERLLASPHYGEQWGRHWLDVVRYAETEGFEYDRHRPGAWRYRDYVIRSLNADKPYDRFVEEQIAGDEIAPSPLPSPPRGEGRQNSPSLLGGEGKGEGDRDCLVAAGFHRLGPVRRNAGNQDVAASRNEVLTERTDALGAIFLGLTVGCARCHDHKFDPIPQQDYYRLQAFLAAVHEHDIPLADAKTVAAWKVRADKVQTEIRTLEKELARLHGAARMRLEERLKEARRRLPAPLPTISTVRDVEEQRTPIHLLKRGDWEKKGDRVGMRLPGAFLPAEAPELPADTRNPRVLLARWITSPDNPLAARVLVNRVWQYHFGKGLVETPNDFGANGEPPSHPELLDWLACEFLGPLFLPSPPSDGGEGKKRGQRLKALHRLILLSSTYRQASRSPADVRLLGRFPRRRLAAEEIRDAMLSVAGRLDREAGGPSAVVPVQRELVQLLYDPDQWAVTKDERQHDRRSVYLLAKRNLRLPFMEAFDRPDLQTSCPRRESSTHVLQALELLNGRTSNRLADAFAARLRREAGSDARQQVERAFLLAVGRPPTEKERLLAVEFLKDHPLREFALAVFNLNAFLYVN
jgi:hypothetical protein